MPLVDDNLYEWSVRFNGSSTSGGNKFESSTAALAHAVQRAHDTFGTDQGAREYLEGEKYHVCIYHPGTDQVFHSADHFFHFAVTV